MWSLVYSATNTPFSTGLDSAWDTVITYRKIPIITPLCPKNKPPKLNDAIIRPSDLRYLAPSDYKSPFGELALYFMSRQCQAHTQTCDDHLMITVLPDSGTNIISNIYKNKNNSSYDFPVLIEAHLLTKKTLLI